MIRRLVALLAAFVLLLGCTAAETASETETHRIEKKMFPFYLRNTENKWPGDFPLYFVDGTEDLPFVELNDWAAFLNWFFGEDQAIMFNGYHVAVETGEDPNRVTLMRENGSSILFDFSEGLIGWDDYYAFLQKTDGYYMNFIIFPETYENGEPYLLNRTGERSRHAEYMLLNLKDYGIPMIAQDGKYLVPLQTLSSFCIAIFYTNLFFNQECIILGYYDDMADEESSLRQLYASSPKGLRSQALTEIGFGELCMELDYFYGLKKEHGIDSFSTFFAQTGLLDGILDPDPAKADEALFNLTNYWLDDGHSRKVAPSYLAESVNDPQAGISHSSMVVLYDYLHEKRAEYPDAEKGYYESGNTAYVRFDSFSYDKDIDYYEAAEKDELPDDAIGLLIKAHRMITRENSPIENVVMDLSINTGGEEVAGAFALSWFLGNAQVALSDPDRGAASTMFYQADLNLDHVFDEKDTVSGLNLFCLTSPMSFSCGNLVPWAFKTNGRVTLLGRKTGGGSCVILPLTTAWGTFFRISGPKHISFVKNGAYYDVDQGVEPDYIIYSYDHLYDREKLTEYINSLF